MLEYRASSDNDSGVICGVIVLPHVTYSTSKFVVFSPCLATDAATYDLCDAR